MIPAGKVFLRPLAGIFARALLSAQEIPGGLFTGVTWLVKLLNGQLVMDLAHLNHSLHFAVPLGGQFWLGTR